MLPCRNFLAGASSAEPQAAAACSSSRSPRRTSTINADQENGSFIANNGGHELGDFLPWECYAVTLQNAGLTWRIYQGSDSYGDNGAQYFATFAHLAVDAGRLGDLRGLRPHLGPPVPGEPT